MLTSRRNVDNWMCKKYCNVLVVIIVTIVYVVNDYIQVQNVCAIPLPNIILKKKSLFSRRRGDGT